MTLSEAKKRSDVIDFMTKNNNLSRSEISLRTGLSESKIRGIRWYYNIKNDSKINPDHGELKSYCKICGKRYIRKDSIHGTQICSEKCKIKHDSIRKQAKLDANRITHSTHKYRYPKSSRKSIEKWTAKNKIKKDAHLKLRYNVKMGRIKKSSICFICGDNTLLHGHHQDYSRPLDVVWLCAKCHQYIHRLLIVIKGETR